MTLDLLDTKVNTQSKAIKAGHVINSTLVYMEYPNGIVGTDQISFYCTFYMLHSKYL